MKQICCKTLVAILSSCTLFALPKEGKLVSGDAQMQSDAKHLQITTSRQAILHWKEFSIGSGERVQFIQPSASSAVLNRVKGSEASQILGRLDANGKVYLVNPNGIVFGKEAIIDTADFLASTLDLSDDQFLLGQELLFSGNSNEAIINYGTIAAADGHITLIGKLVDNQGLLSAPKGAVNIGAAQEILLKLEDKPLLTIRPTLTPDGTITHTGQIEALVVNLQAEGRVADHGINIQGSVLALNTVEENGKIFLKSDGIEIGSTGKLEAPNIAIDAGSNVLNIEGQLVASEGVISIESDAPFFHLGTCDVSGAQGGTIQINSAQFINDGALLANGHVAEGGTIGVHTRGAYIEMEKGTVEANGVNKGGVIALQSDESLFSSGKLSTQAAQGGEISIASPILTLVSADVNACGVTQGGQIFIGGGAHGELRQAPNALTTRLGGNTRVAANAADAGDGGKIVIWSDEKTICYGRIEASGGHGGWIEVSGKQDLCCAASLTANAMHGSPGTIVLDPKTINIALGSKYPQYEFIDPTFGSGSGGVGLGFGNTVVTLSTGNVVITKPSDNVGGAGAGAVYLYNGLTAALISTITGSAAGNAVGSTGVTALTNGNYVVISSNWDNGGATNAGAVTWANGSTGITGTVSSNNSLVGTTTNDQVGFGGVKALTNNNYVVSSPNWDNGIVSDAGAATWGNGATGVTGTVSSSNSLVGTTMNDQVSGSGVSPLTNGNYVVNSSSWTNGGASTAGAATWGNGATGITGTVSTSNSLVGTVMDDRVGIGGTTALSNGNYVVVSLNWGNGGVLSAGAVTLGNGATGTTGAVTTSNSLVGTTMNDQVGDPGVTALTNGNYVVTSMNWSQGGIIARGAATLGNGTSGIVGTITSSNSLIGTTLGDSVGFGGATALTNGNYVVVSTFWTNTGIANCGAVTFGNGTSGIVGPVTTSNSLVGTKSGDLIGSNGVTALANGNYVVSSSAWDNGIVNAAGASTWGNGTSGIVGTITSSNSLVGTQTTDLVGIGGAIALTNGNYVVNSSNWRNGGLANAGAATWANGTTGITGTITTSNSLVGTKASDFVGSGGIALRDGNYVVASPNWDNGSLVNAGAATLGNGTTGTVGTISSQNSIVGTVASANLRTVVEDVVNGTFLPVFLSSGTGEVFAGLQNPNQLTFARASSSVMSINPSFLTDTLNTGSAVQLQASNDININSPIAATGGGALSLLAGRSVLINADIATPNGSLTVVANSSGGVAGERDGGAAVLAVANGVTIDTGVADLTLTLADGNGESGDVTLGDHVTLRSSGSGSIHVTATDHNIELGNDVLITTVDGLLQLTAGVDIVAAGAATIQTTGSGELILLSDNLFPTPPGFGNGGVQIPEATLTTGGGKLLIYTSQRSLNRLPPTINGVLYVPGPEFFNTPTEQWGVYYPHSSGIPFTIFYKQPAQDLRALYDMMIAIVEPFQFWQNPWYSDLYFSTDRYPPYLTQKALRLKLPTLMVRETQDEGLDWLP